MGRNGQRHSSFGSHGKAFTDRVLNVPEGFLFRLALADAARYRRAFDNIDAIFVSVDRHHELHALF